MRASHIPAEGFQSLASLPYDKTKAKLQGEKEREQAGHATDEDAKRYASSCLGFDFPLRYAFNQRSWLSQQPAQHELGRTQGTPWVKTMVREDRRAQRV